MPGVSVPHSVRVTPSCRDYGAESDHRDDVSSKFTGRRNNPRFDVLCVVDLGYCLGEGDDLETADAEGEGFPVIFFSIGPSFTNFASNVLSGFFQ